MPKAFIVCFEENLNWIVEDSLGKNFCSEQILKFVRYKGFVQRNYKIY